MDEIEAQAHVRDGLTAEIAERVRLQHQIIVVAVALAGASGSFLPELLSSSGSQDEGDLALALLALLFMAFAVVFIEHDIQIALAARFKAGRLGAFNSLAFGEERDGWETFRGEKYTAGYRTVLAASLTVARYAVTAGAAVVAYVARGVRADGVPPFSGHAKTGEVVALSLGWMLFVAFVAAVAVSVFHFNRAGRGIP
jgi:hypothetical protein